MPMIFPRALLALSVLLFSDSAQAQFVSITGGVPSVQDFNSLASTGSSTALPDGWYLIDNGDNSYTADSGTLSSGNTYSYGATGNSERALGSIASGSVSPRFGAQLRNDTGAILTELAVQYTAEQWRLGDLNGADRLNFQISSDATLFSNGTWTDADALDLVSPVTTGTASSTLDGNAAANRAVITATLAGFSIAPGASLWVRWVDSNDAGVDDALAIDDASFGVVGDNPPQLTSSSPENGDTAVSVGTTITLNFSEAVTTAPDPWFALDCEGQAIAASASGAGTTRTITPATSLPFGKVCSLSLAEANIRDTDGTADALVAGAGYTDFSFTTAIDAAPTVQGTSPAHNAMGVAVNVNLAINFSEPVSVPLAAADWITLSCNSVNRTGVVSGAGATYSFNPDALLTPGESCAFTLNAANIADIDGVAQTLGGQTVFAFTVAPDNAPTILSTFPADGAVNVAAATNLSVVFSEPVSVTANAFLLECPTGAVLAFASASSDQITWTLNPNADLPINTVCLLSIDRSEIADIDGSADLLVVGAVIDFTTSAGVAGYYQRVDASSCRTLRATLHGVIDDHVSFPYTAGTTDTFDIVEDADEDLAQPGMILDVYENKRFLKGSGRADSTCTGRFNREHTWPKSLGFPSETGDMGLPNAPHTDGHMLYASNCQYNSNRGNNPYRNCDNPTACSSTDPTVANYGVGGVAGQHNRFTGAFYETWSERKGDVARAVLYMDVRYEGGTNSRTGQSEPDLVLTRGSDAGTPGSLDTLLPWHTNDPPSDPAPTAGVLDNLEPIRNDVIESYQTNRNPLIDHPEWAAMLFANPCLGPAVVAVDDDFVVTQDTTLTRVAPGVLRDDHNGSTKNGQGLSASIVTPAANGTATITNATTGAFTYTPTSGYCGTDSFTYQASNGSANDQGIAHIVVTCTTPNAPPVAVADNANVSEDSGINMLDVLVNDTDVDAGPKMVVSVTQPVGGVVTIGSGGANVRFTPNLNFCASTSFDYALNGGSSTTVSITMTCINDAPVLGDSTVSLAENSAIATVVSQLAATDPDAGTTLAYTITAGNGSGAFAISPSGQITVASSTALNFEATPVFLLTVTVSDNATPTAATDTATITINLGNVEEGPAQAASDVAGANEDGGQIAISVLTNDTPDPDGGALAVIGVNDPANGAASFTASGVTYSPDANFCGSDAFDYQISGNISATITVTVACVNDAPTAAGSLPPRSAQEGMAIVSFSVAGGFSDIDIGDDLDYSQSGLPAGLTLDAETGTISGTPSIGSAAGGNYTVIITATDGESATQPQQSFQYTVTAVAPSDPHVFGSGFEN